MNPRSLSGYSPLQIHKSLLSNDLWNLCLSRVVPLLEKDLASNEGEYSDRLLTRLRLRQTRCQDMMAPDVN